MGYEIYTRQIIRASSPMITLNRRGRMVFNVAATKIMHDLGVETAFLLWDSESKKFAVKPTSKRDERAVNVRYSEGHKWAALSAIGFIAHIGHDMETTKAYPAVWNANEGMFEVSMDSEDAERIRAKDMSEMPRHAPVAKIAGVQRRAAR
jgi:hypothetical protein